MFTNRILTIVLLLSALAVGVMSCSDPNPQLPLHEEEIRILTDVMLLEGVLQDYTGAEKARLAPINYDVLYDRHGITEADLQAIRQRYSEDPSLWSRAADSIETRLKRGRTDFESLLNPELN